MEVHRNSAPDLSEVVRDCGLDQRNQPIHIIRILALFYGGVLDVLLPCFVA